MGYCSEIVEKPGLEKDNSFEVVIVAGIAPASAASKRRFQSLYDGVDPPRSDLANSDIVKYRMKLDDHQRYGQLNSGNITEKEPVAPRRRHASRRYLVAGDMEGKGGAQGALERQAAVEWYPGWLGRSHVHSAAAGDGDGHCEDVGVGGEPEAKWALAHKKRRAAGLVDMEAVRDGELPRLAYDVEGSVMGKICLNRCADLTMYVLYYPNVGA